ncbi:LysR substrate-binding domain-containing protein [Alicyclobacillus sacchari]|uniref:LysR substrate-binding domain-containing protein n=1 Tax=Alicyclobacillus sacchari TaxID=392010 RepID=UPI003D6769C6
MAPVESVKEILRTGKYVSFVPKMTVQRELLSGEFVQIEITDLPVYKWNISMIYRERKQMTGPVNAVLNAYSSLNSP